jgi:hypothetical protein
LKLAFTDRNEDFYHKVQTPNGVKKYLKRKRRTPNNGKKTGKRYRLCSPRGSNILGHGRRGKGF